MKGFNRTVAQARQNGEMPLREGKAAITFAAYNKLAWYALNQTSDFRVGIFSHLFLLLCWSLMARCCSVSGIMFEHITWEGDSLIFRFPTHKGDKEGKNCYPKHTYCNRTDPEVCIVLSLAIYVFCMGTREGTSERRVFASESKNTEKKFSTWLLSTCRNHSAELRNQGLQYDDIGTHSMRKGIATFMCSMIGGPSPIAVYLRAGNKL